MVYFGYYHLAPFYGSIIMQFFKNPEYNALKMVFMLFFFILVSVFALGNVADRQAGNTARVLPETTTVKKDRPWRGFAELQADGKLNGRTLTDMLEVTISYDTTNQNTATIDTLVVKKAFTPRAKNDQKGFKIQTVDTAGKVITSQLIRVQKTEISIVPPQNGSMTGKEGIESSKGSVVVLVPFVENATTVRVVNTQGAVIVAKSLVGVTHLNNTPTFKALDGREFQKSTRMPEQKAQSSLFAKSVLAAGDPTKYEFVFIGNGYSSAQLAQFHTDVNTFVNKITTIEPTKSRASQLSFAYVDNTTDLSCVHQASPPDGRLVICNNTLATQLVNTSGAPYDKIVIINNEPNYYGGSGGTIPVAYNGSDGPIMIVHEAVGHSLGQLTDVYSYGMTGVIDNLVHANNCYAGTPPASTWSGMVGSADYTAICQNTNWYDAGTSVMDTLGVAYFTAPEQKSINTQLDIYAGAFSDVSNPTVSITSPANNTIVTTEDFVTVSATASDNLGVARVAFSLDGTLIKNVYLPPYSFTFLNFPSGTHSIQARAYDAQNNATTSTISVTRSASSGDTTAPTAPTNLTSSNVTVSSVVLTWGVSSDNIAVSAYDVYQNGTLLTSTQQNTYTPSALTGSTAYSFYVKARDAAGNISSASNTISVTTQSINNGTTVITNPTQGQVIAPGVVTPINVTAPANATSVRFYQQFNSFSVFDIGGDITLPFSTNWTPQSQGTYTFTANSYAGSTLIGTSNPVVVTVGSVSADVTAPSTPTNLISPSKTASSVSLSWNSSTDNSGGSGMAGYYIYQNGSSTPINASVSTGTSYVVSALIPSTAYTFIVKAKDVAGNYSGSSNSIAVTTSAAADTTAPTAPTGLTLSSKTNNSVAMTWSASTDAVGVTGYDVYKNGVLMDSTLSSTSISATGLSASTSYSFTVKARDAAGNVSSASNTLTVTTDAPLDTTAPSAPTNLTVISKDSSSVSFSWNASTDAVGVTGYKVYRSTTLLGTVTGTSYTATGLSANTAYNFTVNAIDAAGNTSTSSAILSVTTNVALDTTAPTAPTGLSASNTTQTGTTISWSASTDAVGVTGYDVYKNGALISSSTSTSYTASGLTASTTYSFTVKARDAAGNVSATSSALSVTTTAVTTAATVVTYPVAGQTVTKGVSVMVTMTAPSNATNVKLYRKVGSSSYQYHTGTDSSSPYTVSWKPQNTGTYKLVAKSYAGTTLIGTSEEVTVTSVAQ